MAAMPTGIYTSFLLCLILLACSGRNHVESQSPAPVKMRHMNGASCEDCELMLAGIPKELSHIDTSDGWFEEGQKLVIKGTVFLPDGKTPAKDVILYYYHTDQKGIYDPGKESNPGARRHGRLRGWVKTGNDGTYQICTSRPAQYPDNTIEAHIHVIVQEPDISQPYWIDAWVFDDDPYLTPAIRSRLDNAGGSGIMTTITENGIQIAEQDVFLGLNVRGYPR